MNRAYDWVAEGEREAWVASAPARRARRLRLATWFAVIVFIFNVIVCACG